MLNYNKRKTEFGYTINITDGDKELMITFGGNLDLYWYLTSKEEREVDTFEITKENYFLFLLFDNLYNDIVNCNLFKVHDDELLFINSIKELQRICNKKDELNRIFKEYEEYKNLYNGKYICWYSDDDPIDDANYVKIIKKENSYVLEFTHNKKSTTLYFKHVIRFRNVGSRYKPFNIIFMNMYNILCNSEYDENQLHIEEYLYKKKKR